MTNFALSKRDHLINMKGLMRLTKIAKSTINGKKKLKKKYLPNTFIFLFN